MHPVFIKFLGAIVVSMIIFSPSEKPKETYNPNRLENAQAIADRSGRTVKAWMDKSGHITILFAEDKPIEPYVMLHSTWKPR